MKGKIIFNRSYQKGEIYSPDDVNDLPKSANEYFSNDDEFQTDDCEFEFGSVRCVKSFEIIITVKETKRK